MIKSMTLLAGAVMLLATPALAKDRSPDQYIDMCASAVNLSNLKGSVGSEDPVMADLQAEAFVGRKQKIIEREQLTPIQAEFLSIICSAYMRGSLDNTVAVMKMFQEQDQSRLAARQK